MTGSSDVDTTAATVAWETSTAHDFAFYRLYRDFGPGVGTFSTLVAEIAERDVTSFRDTGLTKATVYYYRIFVVDDGENPGPESAGSEAAIRVETEP